VPPALPTVNQAVESEDALQAHPPWVVTETVPPDAAAVGDALAADNENVHTAQLLVSPQYWPLPQDPQLSVFPQPSECVPHVMPGSQAVLQSGHTLLVHVPLAHEPQLETVRALPQLSVPERVPQFFCRRWQNCASVSAVQSLSVVAFTGFDPADEPREL
jgi:hypothetical protein